MRDAVRKSVTQTVGKTQEWVKVGRKVKPKEEVVRLQVDPAASEVSELEDRTKRTRAAAISGANRIPIMSPPPPPDGGDYSETRNKQHLRRRN